MSGGYEDDIDEGFRFTYTGSGGRDLKGTKNKPKNLRTAPQSCDQTLAGFNLALKTSCDTRQPVRVIRGYKAELGPAEGYRYDGLYTVMKAWEDMGLAGFKVWRFAFKRVDGQAPINYKGPILLRRCMSLYTDSQAAGPPEDDNADESVSESEAEAEAETKTKPEAKAEVKAETKAKSKAGAEVRAKVRAEVRAEFPNPGGVGSEDELTTTPSIGRRRIRKATKNQTKAAFPFEVAVPARRRG